MKTISNCRICKNTDLIPIVSLGNQRISSVFPKDEKIQPSYSPLVLVRCNNSNDESYCGLVQLKHTADLNEMYGTTYGYHSSLSPSMANHLKDIYCHTIEFAKPKEEDLILDIGCNDGTMLNFFGTHKLGRYGIDPSSKKFIDNFDKDITVTFDFFSKFAVRKMIKKKKFKIITSIAMFYDIEDPTHFMEDIKSLLTNDGIWVLELSYFVTLLENLTYDQICHEHVTYLAIKDMLFMMKKVGLRIFDVKLNTINGGSFMITAGHHDSDYTTNYKELDFLIEKEKSLKLDKTYERFSKRLLNHKDELKQFIKKVKNSGKTIYGYGASTKGNIVLNYCDIDKKDLPAISDRNKEKHGLITPGTNIPIISHEKMKEINPDYLLVLIWHFRKEVIDFEIEFLKKGGKLIFHLPRLHIVDKNNYKRYANTSFEELAYPI